MTELVFAAGAGDLLVGVSTYSDYPAAARALPVVGNFSTIDYERLISLRPDLVIGWQTGNAGLDTRKLTKLKIPVYMTEMSTLEDIPATLRNIGKLTARKPSAEAAAEQFEFNLARLRKTNMAQPKVFYEVWHAPLMTVNGTHSISDVISRCGGVNIFADLKILTPRIGIEDILIAQPDAIITTRPMADAIKYWEAYPELGAVKDRHIYSIPADYLHRPTPRILVGADRLCQFLDSVRLAKKAVSPSPK